MVWFECFCLGCGVIEGLGCVLLWCVVVCFGLGGLGWVFVFDLEWFSCLYLMMGFCWVVMLFCW